MRMNPLTTVTIMSVILISGCNSCNKESRIAEQYFEEVYEPTQLTQSLAEPIPADFNLKDVPWYCYENNNCQAVSLQMIAEKYGISKPVDFFSFLVGNTYGAMYTKGAGTFFPGSDPEPGYIVASRHLGLSRKYLYSDDSGLFLQSLRYYLSQGLPVRIAWNSMPAVKYAIESGYFTRPPDWKEPSKNAFSPHSVVFVGYDSASFYYYETIANKEFVMHGEKGIRIPEQTVLEAVSSLSSRYKLPWKYMFTVLVKETLSTSLKVIWERNGTEMIGNQYGPTCTGSLALEAFAGGIKREGLKMNDPVKKSALQRIAGTLAEERFTNATYLKQTFGSMIEIQNAARLLVDSYNNYEEITKLLEPADLTKNSIDQICKLFNYSAECERKAGQIFLSVSNKFKPE
jgi:hypothetical protein